MSDENLSKEEMLSRLTWLEARLPMEQESSYQAFKNRPNLSYNIGLNFKMSVDNTDIDPLYFRAIHKSLENLTHAVKDKFGASSIKIVITDNFTELV